VGRTYHSTPGDGDVKFSAHFIEFIPDTWDDRASRLIDPAAGGDHQDYIKRAFADVPADSRHRVVVGSTAEHQCFDLDAGITETTAEG
jgi:hypothetical protein